MISNVFTTPDEIDRHTWVLTGDEIEIDLGGGHLVNLNANFGVEQVAITGLGELTLAMRSLQDNLRIILTWEEVIDLKFKSHGPIIPADDGLTGIYGLRLMNLKPGQADFIIDGDWFEAVVSCRAFKWVEAP